MMAAMFSRTRPIPRKFARLAREYLQGVRKWSEQEPLPEAYRHFGHLETSACVASQIALDELMASAEGQAQISAAMMGWGAGMAVVLAQQSPEMKVFALQRLMTGLQDGFKAERLDGTSAAGNA